MQTNTSNSEPPLNERVVLIESWDLLHALCFLLSDINECQINAHECLESQRCDNTIGSYTCIRLQSCGTGYTLNAETGNCDGKSVKGKRGTNVTSHDTFFRCLSQQTMTSAPWDVTTVWPRTSASTRRDRSDVGKGPGMPRPSS